MSPHVYRPIFKWPLSRDFLPLNFIHHATPWFTHWSQLWTTSISPRYSIEFFLSWYAS
jgi:hypothetical protein